MTPNARLEGLLVAPSAAVSRARRVAALAALGAAAGLAALPLLPAATQAFLGCVTGVMLAVTWRSLRRAPAGAPATADVSEEALTLEHEGARTELLWTAVTSWRLHTRDDRDVLELTLDDGSTRALTLPDDGVLAAVLAPLRKAFARRALTVPLRGRFDASAWTVAAAALAVVAPLPLADLAARGVGLAAGLAAWVVGAALVVRLAREVRVSKVTVGDDGVALRRMGWERFIPWSFVEAVDWDEYGVVLRLIDGEEVSLPLLTAAMVRGVRDASVERAIGHRDALHERLRAGLDRWRARRGAPDELCSLLDRQGRDFEDWRASVGALVERFQGYRAMRLDPQLAACVIDDPTAPLERRVAAVWALRQHDATHATTRVRVALEASACEPVRELLALAAEDVVDEATLERASESAAR